MTGILTSKCRLISLILVALVLLGSAVTSTAQNPSVVNYPTWSPDGRMIAFISQAPEGGLAIFRMNEDGTNKTQITPISASWSRLSWSPDGGRIAFHDTGPVPPRTQIFVVDIDGSNRRSLTSGSAAWDSYPTWSPDGSRILFSRVIPPGIVSVYSGPVLHTIDPEGTDLRMLPHGFMDGFGDSMPSWSPAGDKIVFVVNVWDFVTNIFIANADGTDRRFFHGCYWFDTSCRLDALNPQFSPDGTRIIFIMFDFVGGGSQIFSKNIDGTGLTLLADSAQTFSWQTHIDQPSRSALDFDGSGSADILWRDIANGSVSMSLMNGATILSNTFIANVSREWTPLWKADFNGDRQADILWRHSNGSMGIWLMNGPAIVSASFLANVSTDWKPVGVGDFNSDGKADLLWRHSTGDVAMWLMNGAELSSGAIVEHDQRMWRPVQIGDFNGDGKADIVVRHKNGDLAMWLMDGATVLSNQPITNMPLGWIAQ